MQYDNTHELQHIFESIVKKDMEIEEGSRWGRNYFTGTSKRYGGRLRDDPANDVMYRALGYDEEYTRKCNAAKAELKELIAALKEENEDIEVINDGKIALKFNDKLALKNTYDHMLDRLEGSKLDCEMDEKNLQLIIFIQPDGKKSKVSKQVADMLGPEKPEGVTEGYDDDIEARDFDADKTGDKYAAIEWKDFADSRIRAIANDTDPQELVSLIFFMLSSLGTSIGIEKTQKEINRWLQNLHGKYDQKKYSILNDLFKILAGSKEWSDAYDRVNPSKANETEEVKPDGEIPEEV